MMFRSIAKIGNGHPGRRHARPDPSASDRGGRGAVVEDYGDDCDDGDDDGTGGDHSYWRVALPNDDLDRLMWGSVGAPPPAAADGDAAPVRRRRGRQAGGPSAGGGDGDGDGARERAGSRDNVLSALDRPEPPPLPPPPPPDDIVLEDIAWKQRSGFGKYSFGILTHEWERRRLVLFESGMLRYYALKDDMEGVRYDPKHATDPERSPWAYDSDQDPRGEMDLRDRREEGGRGEAGQGSAHSIHSAHSEDSQGGHSLGGGMRRLSSLVHHEKAPNAGGAKIRARGHRRGEPGPTPFEVDVVRRDNGETWRFCFQSRTVQREWLLSLRVAASDFDVNDNNGDGPEEEEDGASEGLSDFRPGDHIMRWEMLPIVYPIQVHGIVLEAGKNCVIIADFGLASYDNRRFVKKEGLTTLSDDGKDDSHDAIMAAWEKIKPREKRRLNVVVVTDPKEIRKWSKINYGDHGGNKKEKKGFLSSLLPWESRKKSDESEPNNAEGGKGKGGVEESEAESTADGALDAAGPQNGTGGLHAESSSLDKADDADASDDTDFVEGEPDWLRPGYRPRKRAGSSSSTVPLGDGGQSVFSVDHDPGERAANELPKSDSAKLVLARTHFALEHEELLPPYHVFYSNSECIAVWCKTGRWSTLQAAVYLVSSSVGFGKSATMLAISAAAAHAILVPAVAVGGLAVVSAPLLFLRKSQDKWDKTTMELTDKFWSHASPDVFVEAVEYWGKFGKS